MPYSRKGNILDPNKAKGLANMDNYKDIIVEIKGEIGIIKV